MALASGLTIVVPVYRSAGTLAELVSRITASLGDIPHEIVLVDDGSSDATWSAVRRLASTRVRGLRLGRNAGQHAALVAGVRTARYDRTVTIDDDLQNPPEEIPRLLARLDVGDVDVVYGVSAQPAQDRWRRAASRWSRRVIADGLDAPSASSLSAFRAFRTSLRDAFDQPLGPNVSLDAVLSWGTDRFGEVTVAHHPRREGTSNYTLRKLVRFMIDTATGYSIVPLRLASAVGLATLAFGIGLLAWVVGRPLLTGESVPGFPLLASSLTIFSGAQLVLLGVLGEYIGRMHFRVMHKPTYVVAETTDASA